MPAAKVDKVTWGFLKRKEKRKTFINRRAAPHQPAVLPIAAEENLIAEVNKGAGALGCCRRKQRNFYFPPNKPGAGGVTDRKHHLLHQKKMNK